MDTNSPVRNLLITCAVLIVFVAGIYWYMTHPAPVGSPSPAASTTSQTLPDGSVVSGLPAGATVTDTTPTAAPVAPDYRKKIVYDISVTAEVKAAIEPRFAQDVDLLNKNSQNFNVWMDLAILHKIGGDYHGAESIWLYVTKNWPTSYVAFHNLGDLYENFLHDQVKAKFYYAQAAKLTP